MAVSVCSVKAFTERQGVMHSWTKIDIAIIITQMLLAGFYKDFVESSKKLKFITRCTLNRLFVTGAVCTFILERFGIFGRGRYSIIIFANCIFWITLLLISMLFSEGWCCVKCGKRIGLKLLVVSKCPYCHES
ncbi:hypothetical protein HMPREF0240_00698 [Clostridium sp. D5]|nr:hypothetical protein HMPREF0240_00698 [Clostridium sp. D5]